MTTHSLIWYLRRICVGVALLTAGTAATEPLKVGFEHTQVVDEKSGLQENLRRCGWTFSEPLRLPAGWRPNPGASKNGEYRLITAPAQAHSGACCIYLRGHLMIRTATTVTDVAAGDEITLRFHARDPAKKDVAAMFYTYQRDEQDKSHFIVTIPFFTAKTDDAWTECAGTITIPETAGGKRVHAVIVVLSSATGAFFDDVTLSHTKTVGYRNFQDAEYAGRSAAKLKDYAAAHRAFDTALALAATDSERVAGLLRIAETFKEEKRHVDAAETFERVLGLSHLGPEVALDIRRKQADAYMAGREFEQARGALETALATLSESDEARIDIMLDIATCFEKEQQFEPAVQTLTAVLALSQADCRTKVAAQFRIGAVWVAARRYEEARKEYLNVLPLPAVSAEDRFEVWERTGNVYRSEKQWNEARLAYRKALAVEVVNPYSQARVISAIGTTLMSEERYAEAREVYHELIDMHTEAWQSQVYAWKKVGEAHRFEKTYTKERDAHAAAVKIAKSVRGRYAISQINSVESEALRLTADSYWTEGRKDEARRAYLEWLEFGLVPVKEAQQKQVEALIGVNECATCIGQGHRLLAEREYAGARVEFEKALNAGEGTARQKMVALMGCGESHVAEKAYGRARLVFEQALSVDGAQPDTKADAQMRIGDCWAIVKDYREARGAYSRVLSIPAVAVAQRAQAREKIAVLYRAENNVERARREYAEILRMDGIDRKRATRIAQRLRSVYR